MTIPTIAYAPDRLDPRVMVARARQFESAIAARRSVREFSSEDVPDEVLRIAIASAASAPSGANLQPWTFVVVRDRQLKARIRTAAEEEERINYGGRMPQEWLDALAPLQTDWRKEFLEIAPALIVVFKQEWGLRDGHKIHHYYVNESVGIACGLLLAALQLAGVATLTHTPSPMGFLREILERPENEKPYVLIPIGYPSATCRVPDIRRKSLDDVAIWK